MLGLKYALAVRPQLLHQASAALFSGLSDLVDDVRSVAAEALTTLSPQLAAGGEELLPTLLSHLHLSLCSSDELGASSVSVIRLLSDCCSALPPAALATVTLDGEEGGIGRLLCLVWPFFRHPSATARRAAIQAVHQLLRAASSPQDPPTCASRPPVPPIAPPLDPQLSPHLGTGLHLLFEAQTIDPSSEVRLAASPAWRQLLSSSSPPSLAAHAAELWPRWLHLASSPVGSPLPPAAELPQLRACEGGSEGERWGESGVRAEGGGDARVSEETHERFALALGSLAQASSPSVRASCISLLRENLTSPSSVRRRVGGWVVACWAREAREVGGGSFLPDLRKDLGPSLLAIVEEGGGLPVEREELAPLTKKARFPSATPSLYLTLRPLQRL